VVERSGTHLAGQHDCLLGVRPLLESKPVWEAFGGEADAADFGDLVHAHASAGRPLGPDSFVESLERSLQRPLKRKKPGPRTQERGRYTLDLFEEPERN
jgi:hypothetical protein